MATFDPTRAVNVLMEHAQTYQNDPQAHDEYSRYLEDAKKFLGLGISSDDRREACKLAIEAAKLLITIGVGILVAVGTFVQFSRSQGVPWISWTMLCFLVSAICIFLSMAFGFNAISGIYRRADARDPGQSTPVWTTEPAKPKLDWQAWLGMLGLLALVVGLFFWATLGSPPQPALSLAITGKSSTVPPIGPLTVEGKWSDLTIKTGANHEIKIPDTASPWTIDCK
jgi:hypothetical protein